MCEIMFVEPELIIITKNHVFARRYNPTDDDYVEICQGPTFVLGVTHAVMGPWMFVVDCRLTCGWISDEDHTVLISDLKKKYDS